MLYNSLKIVPISEVDIASIAEFFKDIKDNRFFHPHSFAAEEIVRLRDKSGKDLYYCLVDSDKVIAYGILRGWDDRWDDICVGIIVRKSEWYNGYGEMFMRFLHSAARYRKTQRLRLHVNPDNAVAFNLYKRLGYRFNGEMFRNERVGYYDIHTETGQRK